MKPTFLEYSGCLVHPTGSKYICDPPVLDTDEDWAIYAPSSVNIQRELAFYTAGVLKDILKVVISKLGGQ